ncbi:MAG: cation:proton antiporter [Candidatus Woesearchaeota archaeon]
MDIFIDIGIIIVAATLGGFFAKALKQPLIISYILMGILIGPILGLLHDMSVVTILAEIGIVFLLFIVGIELDLKRLKDVGSMATIGAVIQMVLSFLLGFEVFRILGFSTMVSAFAGIVILFSSTMVVIKLLADKAQLDTLHGRIVIGTLLVQDIVAVVILSIIGSSGGDFSILSLLMSVGIGLLVFVVAYAFSKIIFPKIFKFAASSQELFFLLSISTCFLFAFLFSQIGLSLAIGAFVAGIMLGNLPYNVEIISKVKNLRDFFSTIFFVSMGAKLTFSALQGFTLPFIFLLLLTVFFAPLMTFITTIAFGYNRKVAFLSAISLSQVSEFALIAVALGVTKGHIGPEFLSLTILVTLASITVTAYYMKYEDKLYRFLLPVLKIIDNIFPTKKSFSHYTNTHDFNTVLVGYDRIGYSVFKTLRKLHKKTIIVDYNPDIITSLIKQKVPCLYGDIADDEVFKELHLQKAKLIISTIPNHKDTLLLLKRIRRINKDAKIIVTAYVVDEALHFYDAGADYVILPHLLGGHHAGILLEDISTDLDKLVFAKIEHISELKRHKKKRHTHHFLHEFEI